MTGRVPFGKDVPPPLVPLPSCHARVKQLQARLFNGVPLLSSFIANCRLCLGSNFGEKSTTIIEERFSTMLKHVFPFPITNQIGLPMNVCADCYKSIQIFYAYSHQVQANQLKLQETLGKAEYLDYTEVFKAVRERGQYPDALDAEQEESGLTETKPAIGKESQENAEDVIFIDTDVQCKTEADEYDQGMDASLQQPHYDGTTLGSEAKARTVCTRVDYKTNANENEAGNRNAVSSSLEFNDYRKKTRFSLEESVREPLEQSATEFGNRLGPKPPYTCSICNQTFDKHHTLICHQKTHLTRECPICNKSFQYTLLAKHIIQEHTGNKSKT